MIQRVLWHIAGVDRETLATCPATDKVWATHLGFSLLLSFTVVLGISFHATGYVIADVWMRLTAAAVVALTVFMFDRALYQSDWFYQGSLRRRDHKHGCCSARPLAILATFPAHRYPTDHFVRFGVDHRRLPRTGHLFGHDQRED